MLEVVSFDYDSTLSDSRHRWPMIDRVNGTDWDAYGLAGEFDDDGPVLPLAQFLSSRNLPWIVVSGRANVAREISLKWLHDRGCFPWAVFLCEDDRHDWMPHGEWKATRFKEIQKQFGFKITMHFDDAGMVAEAVRADPELDFPVTLVHQIGQMVDHLG
jgi:hypothetical protein